MDFYAIGTKKHFVGKSVLTLNVMVPNKYVSEPSYDLKFSLYANLTYQIRSVTQSCPTLCNPMNRSTPGLPVHHQLPEFTQTHIHWVSDAIQPSLVPFFFSPPIFFSPLLSLPPIPPSIRVFSKESILHMRWPKYWSSSFSIIPSKEIPGLISFRIISKGLTRVFSNTTVQKHQFFGTQLSSQSNSHIHTWPQEKP